MSLKDFGPTSFGDLNADEYDAVHDPGTTDALVELLFSLYGAGAEVLELAVGSGRIALPLSAKGVKVTGFDGSQAMLDLLAAKPGAEAISARVGDMADFSYDRQFDHAFLVFNTLFNLTSQDAQLACFRHTARSLKPGGTFLVETFIPDLSDFANHQRVATKRLDMGSVWLEAATHDPLRQVLEMQRIRITPDGIRLVPLPMRYALPPEIDLMARLAGLEPESRWGGFAREPFTATSNMHVSVYRKPV